MKRGPYYLICAKCMERKPAKGFTKKGRLCPKCQPRPTKHEVLSYIRKNYWSMPCWKLDLIVTGGPQ